MLPHLRCSTGIQENAIKWQVGGSLLISDLPANNILGMFWYIIFQFQPQDTCLHPHHFYGAVQNLPALIQNIKGMFTLQPPPTSQQWASTLSSSNLPASGHMPPPSPLLRGRPEPPRIDPEYKRYFQLLPSQCKLGNVILPRQGKWEGKRVRRHK